MASPDTTSSSPQTRPPAAIPVLSQLASLKLTVILFALGIFIVLAGTLAQTEDNIDTVVQNYFRTMVAHIEVKVFFPRSFFPEGHFLAKWHASDASFPFPGGWLIGLVMVVNLLAAHILRFRVQADGRQLAQGLLWTGLGLLFTTGVIVAGSWQSGETNAFFFSFPSMRILWQLVLAELGASLLLFGCCKLFRKRGGIVVLHGGVLLLLLNELLVGTTAIEGQMPIDEGSTSNWTHNISVSELAIIDRAAADSDAVTVISEARLKDTTDKKIAGALLPFDIKVKQFIQNGSFPRAPQAGDNPLASSGIGQQLIVEPAKENTGVESESDRPSAYVEFYKKGTDELLDTHLFVNAPTLEMMVQSDEVAEKVISGEGPLFPLQLDEVQRARLDARLVTPQLLAAFVAKQLPLSSASWVAVDQPGVRWHLTDGDLTFAIRLEGETAQVYKTYDVYLRFLRRYSDYSIHLEDVRKDDYVGTATPRNYSSDVRIVQASQSEDRQSHIWMNNPLRFNGQTFYQSGYFEHPVRKNETTTLQVVTNTGWMIPYVACMIVGTGVFYQFVNVVLLRYLRRRRGAETDSDPLSAKSAALLAALATEQQPAGVATGQAKAAASQKKRRGKSEPPPATKSPATPTSVVASWPAVVIVVVFGGYLLSKARAPRPVGGYDLHQAGAIPVVYEGRVKPLDTLARTSLRQLSDKVEFSWTMDQGALEEEWAQSIQPALRKVVASVSKQDLVDAQYDPYRLIKNLQSKSKVDEQSLEKAVFQATTVDNQPAMRWFLDLVTRPAHGLTHRVFRITDLELVNSLGLPIRPGSWRYALSELLVPAQEGQPTGLQILTQQSEEARKLSSESMSAYQKRVLALERQIGIVDALIKAFLFAGTAPDDVLQTIRQAAENETDPQQKQQVLGNAIANMKNLIAQDAQQTAQRHPPLMIPDKDAEGTWTTYSAGFLQDLVNELENKPRNQPVADLAGLFAAYGRDPAKFNRQIAEYQLTLQQMQPGDVSAAALGFETFFNQFSPFYYCMVLYVVAFVLAAAAWFGWSGPLNRAAFALIVFTLLAHTWALGGRIYISGRPPVTNLYSSAVFIGWGSVILSLVLERFSKLGIGTLVASVMGFSTLLVGYLLTHAVGSMKGDTFVVMQAVLDTQFWLATHVVCITLGYSTTFLAGFLGLFYVLRGVLSPSFPAQVSRDLTRMIYGTVCFSIFFSFVGTVLGGLWADDSWGRFWGWDPKENGALIIVLWNALVLHARWDGMVRERGLAVLAVVGNIVTAWSWFGVNELGVGLHSYGFTEGVLWALFWFGVSQLAIIGLGLLPRNYWLSSLFRSVDNPEESSA
ncbi:MAG: cytochrome c biogenesis protein CcsA [Planctomycetota bacterium]|nr:cytochrome c biogenesis protein CcsA [Planctomycetota bacterium]